MNRIIKKLEKKVINTTELAVIDKREDGFTYMVAIKRGKDTFVVYTTRGIHHYRKESCFLAIQVTEHVPFNSVAATINGDIVTPYRDVLRSKGVQVGQIWYGLQVQELPVFQKAS